MRVKLNVRNPNAKNNLKEDGNSMRRERIVLVCEMIGIFPWSSKKHMKEGEVESGGGCGLHTSKQGRKKRVGIRPSELPQGVPRKLGPFSQNFKSKATVVDGKTPSGIPKVLAMKTIFPLDLIVLLQGYLLAWVPLFRSAQTCAFGIQNFVVGRKGLPRWIRIVGRMPRTSNGFAARHKFAL